jgi:PleD family two-component response regulator
MDENKKLLRPKILIVDDSQSFLNEMRTALSPLFEIEIASSARNAMGLMMNNKFNLILLDYAHWKK